MKNKICIVISYFGKLPSNFDLWAKSCGYNMTIDFLVCTDIEKPDIPSNIRWLKKSFSELRQLINEKLDMQVKLDTPYECCDLKAAYGVIFEDYLDGYDYWGYCDMDMVFGDLAHFFDLYQLEKYDKFLSYGHLTLFKNSYENNRRFMLPCNKGHFYKEAFCTEGTTQFCEKEINQIFNAYSYPYFDKRICADVTYVFKRLILSGMKNYKHQAFYWQNGKVWRAYSKKNVTGRNGIFVEEFPYIHFQKRKMSKPSFDIQTTKAFYICQNGFKIKNNLGYPTLKDLKTFNPYIFGKEAFEKIAFRINCAYDRINNLARKRFD